MKFYDCSTAPSPRRVRMFIAEKGLDIPTVDVNLRAGEHLGEAFRRRNPFCTVPVLELDDGTCLNNSVGIWRYLEEIQPEPPLMGTGAVERALVTQWEWRMEQDGFHAVAEALRNSAPGLENRALTGPVDVAQIPALAERGKERTVRFLAGLDEVIGDGPFIVGERFSVADITAYCTVEFARWLKLELPADAANARRWHADVSQRPSASV